MKRCNVLKKCFALMMSLALLLTMIPTNVFATTTNSPVINGSKTGSLTINKYDAADKVTPIAGVTFTAYKVFNINDASGNINYTFTSDFKKFFTDKNLTVEKVTEMDGAALEALAGELKTYIKEHNIAGTSKTTNTLGQAVFSPLTLGYYFVDETGYPDQVVTPVAPFFVSIPMTEQVVNEDGIVTETYWKYDVVANPKNVTSVTTGLTLTKNGKVGNGTPTLLQGAEFELQKFNGTKWEKVGETLTTDEFGKITVDGLTRGQYRFVETKAPEGYILNTKVVYEFEVVWNEEEGRLEYVYNKVQNPDLNITVTNEKPTIDKVVDGNLSANIGDTVNWKVTATVPTTINNLETFVITDTLSTGLTYQGHLVVEHNGKTLVKDTDYTLLVQGQVIKVVFKTANLTGSKDVVVKYKTTLNENAVVGSAGNKNEAVLDYSTSTETGSTTKPTKPEVDPYVYTFGLNLTKKNNAGELLNGAEFKLCHKGSTTDCKTLTTTNGVINFTGLVAGEYVLTEVKAPTGYNLLKSPINITITATYKDNGKELDTVTATADSKELTYNQTTGHFEITVLNNKGFQLPATGGMGTVIFTIGGLSLMALASGAYMVSKRKESK